MNPSRLVPVLMLAASALAMLSGALAEPARAARPPARAVQGAWVSPDWLFRDEKAYDEAQIRQRVREAIRSLRATGINTIFVETVMRGTSITPGHVEGGRTGLPVASRLAWPFERRGTRTLDTLQIFIDEASDKGMQVHAWIHLLYWRMDNDGVYRAWQRGPSLWDDLLARWLREQGAALASDAARAPLARAAGRAADSLASGVDSERLSGILAEAGLDGHGNPLGGLVRALMAAGRPAPPFLLLGRPGDPFPRPDKSLLRPVYLDPAHPEVRRRLLDLVASISTSHPDLAGIHLDHIRYPVEGQGIPSDLAPRGRDNLYLDAHLPEMAERYARYERLIEQRREVLASLVNAVRPTLQRGQVLSVAALPLYYVERGLGSGHVNGYDYSSQDWHAWDVDFVVPMMYGFDPWRIRTLVQRYQREVHALRGDASPAVVPGVSRLRMARAGLLRNDDWIFFDLGLGLDFRDWKENANEFQWTPRRDL